MTATATTTSYYARLIIVQDGVEYRAHHDLTIATPRAAQTADLVNYIVDGITDTLDDGEGKAELNLYGMTPAAFAADLIANESEWAKKGVEWDITTDYEEVNDERYSHPFS